MTIDDQIRDEILQYDINREAAKISFSSSGKIHKYEYLTGEDKEEINKIKKIEENVEREKLIYEASENVYDFRNFKTITTLGEDIYEGKITLKEAGEEQSDLLYQIKYFNERTKPKSDKKKKKKKIVNNNLYKFYDGREIVLNAFKSKIFLRKFTGTGISNIDNSKLKI